MLTVLWHWWYLGSVSLHRDSNEWWSYDNLKVWIKTEQPKTTTKNFWCVLFQFLFCTSMVLDQYMSTYTVQCGCSCITTQPNRLTQAFVSRFKCPFAAWKGEYCCGNQVVLYCTVGNASRSFCPRGSDVLGCLFLSFILSGVAMRPKFRTIQWYTSQNVRNNINSVMLCGGFKPSNVWIVWVESYNLPGE